MFDIAQVGYFLDTEVFGATPGFVAIIPYLGARNSFPSLHESASLASISETDYSAVASLASTALQSERADGLKQAVVTPGNHITGVVSVNTALRRGLKECFTEVTLRDVAQRNLIIAREDEVVFNIMTRMARRGASIAVVIKGRGRMRLTLPALSAGSHRRFRRRKYQTL